MNVSTHTTRRLVSLTGLAAVVAALAVPTALARPATDVGDDMSHTAVVLDLRSPDTVDATTQVPDIDPAIANAMAAHQRRQVVGVLRSLDTIVGEPHQAWYEVLEARSDALNHRYGLGEYARTVSHDTPAWLQALDARSDALNLHYGLGKHARTPASNAHNWSTALTARSDALNRQYRLGKYAK